MGPERSKASAARILYEISSILISKGKFFLRNINFEMHTKIIEERGGGEASKMRALEGTCELGRKPRGVNKLPELKMA